MFDLWQLLELAFWTWIWPARHCGLGQEKSFWFQYKKTGLVLFDRSNDCGAIDVSLFLMENYFEMLRLSFSSKMDWGSYTISIAKTASNKVGALIRSMKFRSPDGALYLWISTTQPFMKYYCHVWARAPSFYLDIL